LREQRRVALNVPGGRPSARRGVVSISPVAAGVDGVVCGGDEAAEVRAAHGDALEILVPGVRLAGSASNDQVRVTTPEHAVEAGANYIVVGRTVTGAPIVRDAMRQVLKALAQPA